jgi:hypothetical protein
MAARKAATRAASKAASFPRVSTSPFAVWNNKTILAHFSWDGGEDYLKGDPDGIFTLTDVSGDSTKFAVSFLEDQMPDFWDGVILKSTGDRNPPSADKMAKLAVLGFDDMLFAVRKVVQRVKSDDTDMKRLEGELRVPLMSGKSTAPVQVRMVYLKGVLAPDVVGDPMRDFVVIVFRNPAGGPDPNGGGSGPPDL